MRIAFENCLKKLLASMCRVRACETLETADWPVGNVRGEHACTCDFKLVDALSSIVRRRVRDAVRPLIIVGDFADRVERNHRRPAKENGSRNRVPQSSRSHFHLRTIRRNWMSITSRCCVRQVSPGECAFALPSRGGKRSRVNKDYIPRNSVCQNCACVCARVCV